MSYKQTVSEVAGASRLGDSKLTTEQCTAVEPIMMRCVIRRVARDIYLEDRAILTLQVAISFLYL